MGSFDDTETPADHGQLSAVFKSIHDHVRMVERRVLVVAGSAQVHKAIAASVADPLVEIENRPSVARSKSPVDLAAFDVIVVAGGETDRKSTRLNSSH